MNLPEYDEFVDAILDDERSYVEDKDIWDGMRTMAQHIHALQHRITDLNGCACAYDHPADVCMIHLPQETTRRLYERGELPR